MDARQVAAAAGVSERHVRRLAPTLPGARKTGRDWDIPVSAVARLLADRRQTTPERTTA